MAAAAGAAKRKISNTDRKPSDEDRWNDVFMSVRSDCFGGARYQASVDVRGVAGAIEVSTKVIEVPGNQVLVEKLTKLEVFAPSKSDDDSTADKNPFAGDEHRAGKLLVVLGSSGAPKPIDAAIERSIAAAAEASGYRLLGEAAVSTLAPEQRRCGPDIECGVDAARALSASRAALISRRYQSSFDIIIIDTKTRQLASVEFSFDPDKIQENITSAIVGSLVDAVAAVRSGYQSGPGQPKVPDDKPTPPPDPTPPIVVPTPEPIISDTPSWIGYAGLAVAASGGILAGISVVEQNSADRSFDRIPYADRERGGVLRGRVSRDELGNYAQEHRDAAGQVDRSRAEAVVGVVAISAGVAVFLIDILWTD